MKSILSLSGARLVFGMFIAGSRNLAGLLTHDPADFSRSTIWIASRHSLSQGSVARYFPEFVGPT
jgi:hypothetical protein